MPYKTVFIHDAMIKDKASQAALTALETDLTTLETSFSTKEVWVPVTANYPASDAAEYGIFYDGNYAVAILGGTSDFAMITFKTPDDFGAISEAKVAVIPTASQAAANWDVTISYAGVGQAKTTHSGTLTSTTYNVTDNQIYEINVAAGLASLAAGDYIGIKIVIGTAAHTCEVLGLKFKYTVA